MKEQAKIDKELKIKEMELQAQQAQATTSSATALYPSRNKDAKSPKLPSFIDEKDELDSYLLRFECYAENASWEKGMCAIKLSALLTGRAMVVYIRMSDTDVSDYFKLNKALLTKYNYIEDGYRKRFQEAMPETEETPDQFVIRLKNYLAKWLELSGSSPDNDALVDLIVKEQFIKACSEDLAQMCGSEEIDTVQSRFVIRTPEVHYSATIVKVQKLVPARIRRVRPHQ